MTHNLKHNGAAYNDAAALIYGATVTAGEGRALCSCGLLSEPLASGSARRAWHKEHKLTELDREITEEKAETEALFSQDVLTGTPADEVAEALAEIEAEAPAKPAKKAKVPSKKSQQRHDDYTAQMDARKAKKAAKKAEPEVTAEDERNAYTEHLTFTTAVADSMWRFLGRDGVTTLVDTAFPTVLAKPNNNSHVITFSGPVEDVPAAVEAVKQYWAEAIEAVKAWKETDEAWLARPKGGLEGRKASYFMTGEFYTSYAGKFAHNYVTR